MTEQERDLIRQLTEKTVGGRLRWTEGSLPEAFHLRLGGSTIFVSSYSWMDDLDQAELTRRTALSFRVLDQDGHRVVDLDYNIETDEGSHLAALLEAAARSTPRYEKTLDGLNKILATV